MNGEPLRPVPKPVRATKDRKRLRQVGIKKAARIAAGEDRLGIKRSRPGVHRKAGGTAHSRRAREFGRMKFARETMSCAALLVNDVWRVGPCIGANQYMHLGEREGYRAPDSEGAAGCARHHNEIDNPSGFYIAMSDDERADFRARAIAAQKEAWDALPPEQQEWWDEQAAIDFAKNKRGT